MLCDIIAEDFTLYRQNYERCCRSNDKLLEKSEWKEWEGSLTERAEVISEVFRENQTIIRQHLLPLTRDASVLSDEDFDCLFAWTKDMYINDYEDPFILKILVSILIPHYEALQDITRLVMLYGWMAYAMIEISRTDSIESGKGSVAYYEKVISFAERIGELKTDEARSYIYVAFVNLIFVEPTVANISYREAYEYCERFLRLRREPWFCCYDTSYPRIGCLAKRITDAYTPGSNSMPFLDNLFETEPDAPKFYLSKDEFQAMVEKAGSIYALEPDLVLNQYYFLAEKGKISWNEAFDILEDYYYTLDSTVEENPAVDLISFRVSAAMSLLYFMDKCDYSEELKERLAHKIIGGVIEFFSTYPYGTNTYTLSEALERFSFDRMVLRYLGNTENRLRFVFQLVVARQPVTYIHCTMVSRMVSLIMSFVFDRHPEWLIGTQGTRSVEEVLKNREKIESFANYAALLHDIGKNNMSDIVRTEYRAITDEEFAILKKHPQIGARYIRDIPDFRDYMDVVLGHHQSYNGKGGYPDASVFDHRNSPVRFLIELVTLCDCLDAATDNLGRNYRTAKSFDTVMGELRAGSGVHYNPDLVNMLDTDASLREQLQRLTGNRRKHIYYGIYSQFYMKD